MKNYFQLIRSHQWVKNLFILMPLFFGGQITNLKLLINSFIAFIAFSMVASTIYIVNDFFDIENDKIHPIKKLRPLASGTVSTNNAFIIASILLIIGFSIGSFLNLNFIILLGIYFIINLLYSKFLKKVSLIDICIISIGFLLRIFAGSAVTNIILSKWLVVMTFLLALFLGLAKRRDDVLLLQRDNLNVRSSIKGYNIDFINFSMVMMSSILVVAYLMYSISTEIIQRLNHEYSYLSFFWIILGMLRYYQITFVEEGSADPTRVLLKDRLTLAIVIFWLLTNLLLIYF